MASKSTKRDNSSKTITINEGWDKIFGNKLPKPAKATPNSKGGSGKSGKK